jgi:micrococcal nuclease
MPTSGGSRLKPVILVSAGFLVGLAVAVGFYASKPAYPLRGDKPGTTYRFTTTVTKVVDGDTVVLANGLHLRYRNIDTPETVFMREAPQPFAIKATERNRALVEGKTVTVEITPENTDKYGRLLGTLILPDGRHVEEVLAEEGLGKVVEFDKDDPALQMLKSAQSAASAAGRGVWSRTANDTGVKYIASSTSKIYHVPTCPKAANIKPENLAEFVNEEDAKASGRTACPTCMGKVPEIPESLSE